jgi:hypothetical protein
VTRQTTFEEFEAVEVQGEEARIFNHEVWGSDRTSDADSGECVAAELRMSLASTSIERVAAALPAVYVWLEASRRGLTAPPPNDLVQEIGSAIEETSCLNIS